LVIADAVPIIGVESNVFTFEEAADVYESEYD